MGDETRFRQILLNLVGNALKFTDQGHVKVSVDCTAEGDRLRLVVEDSGIGIPEEARATLFQPFTQAESSTTRRFGGTGLGLSIVAQLVDWLNGDINVESEVGKGTTLTLFFPLVLPARGISATFDGSRQLKPVEEVRKLKVLLTDDNSVNRLVATRMLENMQHEVHQANDGLEALMAMEEYEFDLVLMDVQMPNMDGLTATEKIRDLPGEKGQIPIIGLTANAMASDKEALLKVGMNGYLPKPVRKESLHNTIVDVLQR
jgi:CheY-like chemotaxis protein/anti-sigma regulatory factor (Ser/Thr protein kinase)